MKNFFLLLLRSSRLIIILITMLIIMLLFSSTVFGAKDFEDWQDYKTESSVRFDDCTTPVTPAIPPNPEIPGVPGKQKINVTRHFQKKCMNWCPGYGIAAWTDLGSQSQKLNAIKNSYQCEDPDSSNNTWSAGTPCNPLECPPYCCIFDKYGNCVEPKCQSCDRSVAQPLFEIIFNQIPFLTGGDIGSGPDCIFSDGKNEMKVSTTVKCNCIDAKGDGADDKCWMESNSDPFDYSKPPFDTYEPSGGCVPM